MTVPGGPARQSGAALVITLVMLALTLMLAVSGMHAAQLDERLAGNHRAGVQAQMAAEQGISLKWTDLASQDAMVACGEEMATYPADGTRQGVANHPHLAFSIDYCRRDALVELVSHGYVLSGGSVVAQRDMKVVVENAVTRFRKLSPITVPAPLGDYHPERIRSLSISGEQRDDGSYGPAVSLANERDKRELERWLAYVGGSQQYQVAGGVAVEQRNSLLQEATLFREFLDMLRAESRVLNNKRLHKVDFGTPQRPRLTYVQGDVKINQAPFTGAGVLVIDGDAEFRGTPAFEGLVIVLGDYTTKSDKRSGTLEGALLVAPHIRTLVSERYISANFLLEGGGAYRYDRQALENAFDLLGEAGEFWNDNNIDMTGRQAGQLISWQQLRSDRE